MFEFPSINFLTHKIQIEPAHCNCSCFKGFRDECECKCKLQHIHSFALEMGNVNAKISIVFAHNRGCITTKAHLVQDEFSQNMRYCYSYVQMDTCSIGGDLCKGLRNFYVLYQFGYSRCAFMEQKTNNTIFFSIYMQNFT